MDLEAEDRKRLEEIRFNSLSLVNRFADMEYNSRNHNGKIDALDAKINALIWANIGIFLGFLAAMIVT